MPRLKIVGWSAAAVTAVSWAAALAVGALFATGQMDRGTALALAAAAAVVGEIGLWVAAGCLGLSVFKRRRALLQKWFGKRLPAA